MYVNVCVHVEVRNHSSRHSVNRDVIQLPVNYDTVLCYVIFIFFYFLSAIHHDW